MQNGTETIRELNIEELDLVGGGLSIGAGVTVDAGAEVKAVKGLIDDVAKIAGGALGGIKL